MSPQSIFLTRYLFVILCLLLQAGVGFGVTSLDNAEDGLAVVQVKGAMWGSGLLTLIKNDKTRESNPAKFEIAVITPSHLIQNTLNPVVQVTPRIGMFITGSFYDSNSFVHKFDRLSSSEIQTSVQFQDPLRDIALLKLNLSTDDPLYVTLFDIAHKNLVLCEDEDADPSCFRLKEFYSKISTRIVLNKNVNWILNNNLVHQPLNEENHSGSISLVNDQYISGLYQKIFALSVYGGPGMSGGGFYLNGSLAGMVSKVHYDGYPEVYAIPMNEIYKTLLCFYWKNDNCEKEDLSSRWVTEGNQQFLLVTYKGMQLKQIVAPIPLGFAGSSISMDAIKMQRPLSLEDLKSQLNKSELKAPRFEIEKNKNNFEQLTPSMRKGGGGIVGSGGGSVNPYIYIHHLPGAALMESTGTPLVNPFSLSENNFILNKERYCGLKLSGTKLDLAPNIPRFILMIQDANETQKKSCTKTGNSRQGRKYSPPKVARYFYLNQQLTNENSLHYDFMESSFNSYTQLSPDSELNTESINGFSQKRSAFQELEKFTYNSNGCLNTFPIALCRIPTQSSNVVFKAQVSYMLDRKDPYRREHIQVELSENLDSIILANGTLLKKQKTTSSSISFANENQTTRAVLNFSDQDQGQLFNLFIQTPKLLLQFEW